MSEFPDAVRDLHRHPNQSHTVERPGGGTVTKADVAAAIGSYVEAGGEVDDHGEPGDWSVIADQLTS